MKKNLLLGFIAFAAMAVSSCTNDELNEFIPQGKAIEFNSYLGRDAQARGLVTDAGNGTAGLQTTGFGVYAYLHEHDVAATYTTPNFLTNEKVSGAGWGYRTKYWPKESDIEIDFLAYGPYNADADADDDDDDVDVTNGVLTYNIPSTVADQKDLVVAGAQLDQTSSSNNGTVGFTFYHMLSRLSFDIAVTGAISATVTDASITGDFVTSCTVDMKAVTPQTTIQEVVVDDDETNDVTYSYTISDANKYMMIAPQTLSATVTIDYSVEYEGGVTTTGTATGTLTEQVFAQGKAYKIKATVTGSEIVFNVVRVQGWVDGDEEDEDDDEDEVDVTID